MEGTGRRFSLGERDGRTSGGRLRFSTAPHALVAAIAAVAGMIVIAAASPASRGDEPRELIERAFANLYDHDFVQSLSMSTRLRRGRAMTRRIQIVRKQSSDPGRALVRFLYPPDIRDTSLLVVEQPDRYDDIYLYLPAFRIVRHVAASQRSDSFFGTNITYEDLEPKSASDFGVRSLGPGTLGAQACVRIELRPRTGVESGYSHIESCVDPERAVILRSEFHRDGEIVKIFEVDPDSIRDVGGAIIPYRTRVISPRIQMETLLVVESYEARPSIPDSVFSLPNLEFGNERSDRIKAGVVD